ncbi:hypothetical protein [Streptomyces sp. NRRL S-350]|uniref:hypothetical protein n=1 Tax=Streptomyces sp. NRRL S-350 TaxID=1463902 RepID=UPI0004BFBADA|nr:hypothetical protein [Streptomyces sp. NRRL S-350]
MPELAESRPVTVLPLWRRGPGGGESGGAGEGSAGRPAEGDQRGSADRPGVPRGHSGPTVGARQGKAVTDPQY